MAPHSSLLLASALFALVWACAAQNEQFLALIAANKPKMTPEKAEWVRGMWNQTGGYRLDGSIFDSVFRQAAADGAVDFDAVLQSSWIELPPNFSVQLWIPAVDPVSGAFVAYYMVLKGGDAPLAVRQLGMAAATKDGVVLKGSISVNTGEVASLVSSPEDLVQLYFEGLEERDAKGEVSDKQVMSQYTFKKVPDYDREAATKFVLEYELGQQVLLPDELELEEP